MTFIRIITVFPLLFSEPVFMTWICYISTDNLSFSALTTVGWATRYTACKKRPRIAPYVSDKMLNLTHSLTTVTRNLTRGFLRIFTAMLRLSVFFNETFSEHNAIR